MTIAFFIYSQVVPIAGYDKHGRKVIIDISSKMDLDVGNLEERQRVAMMVMDMGFHKPDFQVIKDNTFSETQAIIFLQSFKVNIQN